MKRVVLMFFIISLCIYSKEIYIVAGAGYKSVVEEIADNYQKESGEDINCIFGNMRQVSTYVKRTDKISMILGDEAFLDKMEIEYREKKSLGEGKLLLIYKDIEISSMDELKKESIEKICVPDPKKAIYGKAAVQALKYYNLYDDIKDKLIVVKTVPQVSSYIMKGEVEIGLINLTDYIKIKAKGIKSMNLDSKSYEKINIELRLLESNGEDFYNYFSSEKSKEILKKYGL